MGRGIETNFVEQRSRFRGEGMPVLSQDRRDESTCRTLSLRPCNMYRFQSIEFRWLPIVSAWLCPSKTSLAVMEAHTSYPSLRHHSIISGIAFLFMLLPDFLMASTMAKLVCNVLSAATASCEVGQWLYAMTDKLLLTYCIGARHRCGRGGEGPYLGGKGA